MKFNFPCGLVILLCSLYLFSGCEENLPIRNNPSTFLVTQLRTQYVYNTPKENSFYIYIIVKNNFDETLEAKADIGGALRIRWQPPENFPVIFISEKNVKLTMSNIYTGSQKYNEATGKLLLDPGDSIVFGYRWDFMTDDKTDLLLNFRYLVDKNCNVIGYPSRVPTFRRISESQTFEISANIKLFDQTAILYPPPLRVTQCFVSHDFGEQDHKFHPCVPIDPNNPCSVLQSP